VHARLLQSHTKLEALVGEKLCVGETTSNSVRVSPHCLSVEGTTPKKPNVNISIQDTELVADTKY
jgi:hypothetical protein